MNFGNIAMITTTLKQILLVKYYILYLIINDI